jgi:hypothetical protein
VEQKSILGLFSLANNDFLHINWDGLADMEELLDGMEENFERILMQEYTKYGLLVEEGTKALVFHDEGDLEASINFGAAEKKGNEVIVEGGTNMEYALRLHEKPYKPGTHDKYDNHSRFDDYYEYGRGERTRDKPNWRGRQPGRKYLENAISATKKDYEKMNERILDRTLEGDSP